MKRDSEKLSPYLIRISLLRCSFLNGPLTHCDTGGAKKGTKKASKNPASLTTPLFMLAMLVALKVSHFAASSNRNAIWQKKLDTQTSITKSENHVTCYLGSSETLLQSTAT